jgi:aryl-alcohol dehydrogenase-like predicted oxidoreductase
VKYVDIPGTDLRPSALALGTATYGSAIPEDTAFRMMDAFAEAGGNVFDTANVYASWLPDGKGASERTIGKWLAAQGRGEGFLVSTKGAHPDLGTGRKRVSRADIRTHLSQSLDRLRTNRVDIYWLHRDDPDVPVGEIIGWLSEITDEGLVRAVGCSNWTVARQREAAAYAESRGVAGFCASQIDWSLAAYAPGCDLGGGMLYMDDATLAFHEETRTPVFAYSSQAGGYFAGKFDAALERPGCDPALRARFAQPTNVARLAAARRLALRKGVSANQIAVAWLVEQSFPVVAIVGPRIPEQAADSFAAGGVRLTAEEVAFLRGGGGRG